MVLGLVNSVQPNILTIQCQITVIRGIWGQNES